MLRPGGRLVFLRNSTILVLAQDMEGVHDRLVRDYFGLHRIHWPDTDLIELQAPVGAQSPYELVSSEWAHRWPSEEIWVARKAPVGNASSLRGVRSVDRSPFGQSS